MADAMNKDHDYSATYVIFYTDVAGFEGYDMTFTCGRGIETVCCCIEEFSVKFVNKKLRYLVADMRATHQICTGDSQLRSIGPEKGVIQLATGTAINAI